MFDIITIGSATRDVYIQSSGFSYPRSKRFKTGKGVCFELGTKIGVEEIHFSPGGSALNTAISFSRLGFRVAAIARVGEDARGGELIRILKEEKVNTSFFQKDKRHGTAYSLLVLSPGGERTILAYRGANESLSARIVPWGKLRTRWFYVSHLSGGSRHLLKPLLRFADRRGIKVAFNPGMTQIKNSEFWWKSVLTQIDILILNREEASYLTRVPYKNERGIFEKLNTWMKGVVVMTEGSRGVWISDGVENWHAGALRERRVEDRTGAGDAFGAGFVAGFIQRNIPCAKGVCYPHGGDIEYALQLASANATSQIEKLGSREGLLRKRDSIYTRGRLPFIKTKV